MWVGLLPVHTRKQKYHNNNAGNCYSHHSFKPQLMSRLTLGGVKLVAVCHTIHRNIIFHSYLYTVKMCPLVTLLFTLLNCTSICFTNTSAVWLITYFHCKSAVCMQQYFNIHILMDIFILFRLMSH